MRGVRLRNAFIPDAPKPENVHETKKTSTSATLVWKKPQYPGFDITYYRIQVPEMKMEKLTNETFFTFTGLKPWTNVTVLMSGCTTENTTSCGLPGTYSMETSVDSKFSNPRGIFNEEMSRASDREA